MYSARKVKTIPKRRLATYPVNFFFLCLIRSEFSGDLSVSVDLGVKTVRTFPLFFSILSMLLDEMFMLIRAIN